MKQTTKKVATAPRKMVTTVKSAQAEEKLFLTEEFTVTRPKGRSLDEIFPIQLMKANSNKGFSFLLGVNRAVIPSHVTKMAESVQKIGITRPVTVAYFDYQGVKDYYIIDGQNLYHALLRLGSDIPYRVIEVHNEQDMVEKIALLNTSSKTWSIQDYVTAWGYIKPDYKTLQHLHNVYDLELGALASLLYGYIGMSCNVLRVIKRGEFEIKNVDKCISILDNITEILTIIPRLDRNANRTFVSAYLAFVSTNYDGYDHAKFRAYIKKHKDTLQFVNADKDMIADFFLKAL